MLAPARTLARRRAASIGLWVLLATYALAAAASGIARAGPTHPELAQALPAALQGEMPTHFARQLIQAGLPGSARDPAARGLSASPIDPAASANLAVARLARGDARGAEAAFRISAELGWREPLTQLYWLRIALDQSDWRNAALRFDALARQYPDTPAVAEAAGLLEASPQSRAMLAGLIAGGARWSAAYAMNANQNLGSRAEVLLEVSRLGRRLGCEMIAPPVRALAASDPQTGAALWRAHCPDTGAPGALADGALEHIRIAGPRTPFEWDLAGHGALETAPGSPGRGGLELRSAAAGPLPVLSQLVALRPGGYRVSWRANLPSRLRISLACRRDSAPPVGQEAGVTQFGVDAQCPARWLQVWIAPGVEPVRLERLSIERL